MAGHAYNTHIHMELDTLKSLVDSLQNPSKDFHQPAYPRGRGRGCGPRDPSLRRARCIDTYGVLPEEVSYSILHDVTQGFVPPSQPNSTRHELGRKAFFVLDPTLSSAVSLPGQISSSLETLFVFGL